MAGHTSRTSRSGGRSKQGGGQSLEAGMFSGVVVRDSFSVVETVRAEAGFTVYRTRFKLTVRNSEGYHKTEEHEIMKRFSDYQALSKQLEIVHAQSNSTMKFPALVKAKYFERFKETVIQQRKKSAEELVNFVSCSPHLSQSSPFHLFIAESKRVSTINPSPPGNNHLPVAPDNLNLTPSPMSQGHDSTSEEGTLSPDVIVKGEEGLSVGFVVSRTPGESIQLPQKNSKDDRSSPLSSSPNLEPNADSLAPVLDTSGLSGGSSVGSNVSLEMLDSSLMGPKPEDKSDKSDDSSSSYSEEEEAEVLLGPKESSPAADVNREEMGGVSRTGERGRGSEMSWWTSAVEEADNVGDDLDAMVDKVEESTPTTKRSSVSKQWHGSSGRRSLPGSNPGSHHGSRHSSRHSSHQGSPVQQRRVSPSAKRESAYAMQAGRLIAQALEYESFGDYEEAFDLMKAGVDVLLNGVQTDQNKDRREVVRRKTSEYLLYAENLQKKLSTMNSVKTDAAASSSHQDSAVSKQPLVPAPAPARPHHLQDFKVEQILGKVMLVESRYTGQQYIFKVLHKSLKAMAAIPRGVSKVTKNRAPSQSPYIVKLLHFYETPNHRIFLLLEYVKKGRLLDYVVSKREQWRRLKEAVINPPPTSSLISSKEASLDKDIKEVVLAKVGPGEKKEEKISVMKEEKEGSGRIEENDEAEGMKVEVKMVNDQLDKSESSDDSEMEKMLAELTSIVPPKTLPPDSSITSEQTVSSDSPSEENNGGNEPLDTLAIMRKRLEESMQDADSIQPDRTGKELKIELSKTPEEALKEEDDEDFEVIDTTIRVLPPTPTVTKAAVGNGDLVMTSFPVNPMNSLGLGTTGDVAAGRHDLKVGSSVPQSVTGVENIERNSGRKGSTDQCPVFTPASLQNSDLKRVDDWSQRLEHSVRRWAAQIVLALEHLHNQNVICRDLHPDNVLINDSGDAVLSYFGKWDFVEDREDIELAKSFYMAPELLTLSKPSVAVDWWCLGTFLFELLTGKCLTSCLPGGTHSHLPLPLPVPLSSEAKSLLTQLLQISPAERLGSGPAGVEEVKAHPFFAGINWRKP